jgi:hypothetical protein
MPISERKIQENVKEGPTGGDDESETVLVVGRGETRRLASRSQGKWDEAFVRAAYAALT